MDLDYEHDDIYLKEDEESFDECYIDSDNAISEIFTKAHAHPKSRILIPLLKSTLDHFVQYQNKKNENTLSAFKLIFLDFDILQLHEEEKAVELRLRLFSHIPILQDPFLPSSTAHRIVTEIFHSCLKDLYPQHHISLYITYQING